MKIYSIPCPYPILHSKKIRSTAKLVYMYLRYRRKSNGYIELWLNEIVNALNIPYGTVRKDIRQLAAIGLIKIDSRLRRAVKNHTGYGRINQYRIYDPGEIQSIQDE